MNRASIIPSEASDLFFRLLTDHGVDPDNANLSGTWNAFKEFCLVSIQCDGEGAFFHLTEHLYDFPGMPEAPRKGNSYLQVCRYFYEDDVGAHLVDCGFEFGMRPELAPHYINLDCSDTTVDGYREFLACVDAKRELWKLLEEGPCEKGRIYVGLQ